MDIDAPDILRSKDLRDTRSRRLVLKVLSEVEKPLTHRDVYEKLKKGKTPVNLVTVYRILKTFLDHDIVHAHPSSGGFIFCELPGKPGHHGLLSCGRCGSVSEFSEPALCALEDRIARRAGFRPRHHLSEIVGVCSSCQ